MNAKKLARNRALFLSPTNHARSLAEEYPERKTSDVTGCDPNLPL